MYKYYLTADKVGDFIAKMWQKGIAVSSDPKSKLITVSKPDGGYVWIHVFDKGSFDELCNTFEQKEE